MKQCATDVKSKHGYNEASNEDEELDIDVYSQYENGNQNYENLIKKNIA